jgi:hypothetical protein
VTPGWAIASVGLPPLAAITAAVLLRPRKPDPWVVIVVNALSSGAGLAAAG